MFGEDKREGFLWHGSQGVELPPMEGQARHTIAVLPLTGKNLSLQEDSPTPTPSGLARRRLFKNWAAIVCLFV